ncbi:hypothetical protein cypCar_00050200, partial [Cyprinus carpio]
MAGLRVSLRRADMQKYGRSSCWICAVFLTLAARLIAQTDASDVLTVTDANWTLILQGEWMIKLCSVVSGVPAFTNRLGESWK